MESIMVAKRIIPCLDVKAGRVVKGVKFLDLRDAGDPVEIARLYDREGADETVFLDITASHEKRGIILDVVSPHRRSGFHAAHRRRRHQSDWKTFAPCCTAGADKVSINTGAVNRPEFVREAGAKIRQPVHRRRHRRQARRRPLGSFHPRRQKSDRHRCCEWAGRMEKFGAGEILLDQHGPRRHQSRL